jgi:7-keto-8-aminopelargonate synthetase-like enzyme
MNPPPALRTVSPTEVTWRGRRLLFFGGCDYHRLAGHPRVRRAAERQLRREPFGVAASRRTTGNHPLYARVERALARFFGAESALVVANGYATNLMVAQALAGRFTRVLVDERAHPALADAAPLFGARVASFAHADPPALRAKLRPLRGQRVIVLTDGMFSFDGSVAPLRAYRAVLPRDAWLLVDDCHGAGVVGARGRGSLEHEGLGHERVIQTITLSKALGGCGGAVLAPTAVREMIWERSRMFVGSTPPPLAGMAAVLEALALLRSGARVRQLQRNAAWLRRRLRAAGITVPDTPGPIISLVPVSPAAGGKLQRRLLQAGILPPFLRYPGSPAGGHFRFMVSSAHSRSELSRLADVLAAAPQLIRAR